MLRKIPVHPILFAVYPILFLYTHNISMLEITYIFLPIFWSIVVVVITWAVLNIFIRDRFKSSAIASLIEILFFSYGHMIVALNKVPENFFGISSDLYLSINYLLILGIGGYVLIKNVKNLLVATGYLNLIGLILIILPLLTIIMTFAPYKEKGKNQSQKFVNHIDKISNSEIFEKLDIYYIILDGYGRNDVLKNVYGYDNENFLRELEKRGFFIARKSRANYAQTLLSLSSSLNMNYLNFLLNDIDSTSDDRAPLGRLFASSTVSEFLKAQGYKIVTFSSEISFTEIKNSDLYIKSEMTLHEFDNLIISSTPLHLLRKIISKPSLLTNHKENILFTLKKIPTINLDGNPMFIFAHIMSPHPPFVLGQDNLRESENIGLFLGDGSLYHHMDPHLQAEYKEKYVKQIQMLNTKLLEMIDRLMNSNNKEKIIILQGDHGPRLLLNWEKPNPKSLNETFPIFNAYYFPKSSNLIPNDSITPVNTFRVIFNNFFDAKFNMLKNKSYFSKASKPYNFIKVD